MLSLFDAKVWFYKKSVDFRRGVDGLSMMVADTLQLDPASGQFFVFRNRQADKVKILWWSDNGFYLLYKRNENYKFVFPSEDDKAIELTSSQLQCLLSGNDYRLQFKPTPVRPSHFF